MEIHKRTLQVLINLWGIEETLQYVSEYMGVAKERITITYDYDIIIN